MDTLRWAIWTIAICLVLIGHAFSSAVAQNSKGEREKTTDFVLAGLRDNRQQMQRGSFRVTGQLSFDFGAEPRRGPVEIFCAFDWSNDLLRFDRTEPDQMPSQGARPSALWGGKIARNRTTVDIWLLNDTSVVTSPSDKRLPEQVRPFDVRGVGLYSWITGSSFETTFDRLMTFYSENRPVQVTVEDGVYHFVVIQDAKKYAEMKLDVWIDGTKGYSPIRLERRFRTYKESNTKWPEPDSVSETTWAQIQGVWVPSTWKIDQRRQGKIKKAYALSFEWEAINSALDARLFTKEGFNLEKGTYLIDRQLNRPIVTGRIGGGPTYIAGEKLQDPKMATASGRFWSYAITIGSLVLILITVCVIRWSRRKKIARGDRAA